MFSTNIIVLICILKGHLCKTEHFINVIPAESNEIHTQSCNNYLQYLAFTREREKQKCSNILTIIQFLKLEIKWIFIEINIRRNDFWLSENS